MKRPKRLIRDTHSYGWVFELTGAEFAWDNFPMEAQTCVRICTGVRMRPVDDPVNEEWIWVPIESREFP